ncbi:flavin reductase family protein [Marinomonas spartinae]|uniref:flavin reductase family protein n=1 Tax=Marinomonas spartinae TaxID=1792290 RepID=UPI0018F24A21|nr:iron-sulfur cluster-binding domain-containing protein [Marinomonas spartinae]MBJ7554856.1 iron-sulfur cluster-binding domain-containing protein [Marinomonas spartinae]
MSLYQISCIRDIGQSIREITVYNQEAVVNPSPGAHFKWYIPELCSWRHYSCVLLPSQEKELTFAMKLNPESPSSQYLMSLREGEYVEMEGPFNHFPEKIASKNGRNIVIAGGIGITPLVGIACHINKSAGNVDFHYFSTNMQQAIYAPELAELFGERLFLHTKDSPSISLSKLLGKLTLSDRIHLCGPPRLLKAVFEYCDNEQFPRNNIAFELFTPSSSSKGEKEPSYEVEAVQSGIIFRVLPDQTLLDALEKAGLDPLYDCRRGECGLCALQVIEGEIDHRDFIMTKQEAELGQVIYPCVSRAKGMRLKLEI